MSEKDQPEKDKLLKTVRTHINTRWESLDKEECIIDVMDRFLSIEQIRMIMSEQYIPEDK
jgi:hypothetical protein